jgi:hypothetical protein
LPRLISLAPEKVLFIFAPENLNFLQFMKRSLRCGAKAILITLVIFTTDLYSQSVSRLVGASPFQDSLWVFDTASFSVIRRMAPSPSSGGAITGTNAIAKHPATGALYVVVKQSAVPGRVLGTLDLNTGVVSIIGNLGDNFSSLTFNGNNTLLGVTGDGASVPETVFRIDQSNASSTLLRALGNGLDGEVICYNPTDNMVYHWSGNGTVVFEKFDTAGTTVTNIPIIGITNGETFGMVHLSGNTFIGSNISSRFQQWNANGTVGAQYGNTSPDDIRGTAFVTCPRVISGTLTFCMGDSTALTMSAGGSAYQWYRDGALIPGATGQTYYAGQAGWYNCFITDMCSVSSGDTLAAGVFVQQLSLPVVTLSGNTTICASDSTLLTGTSGGTSQWYLNGAAIAGATSTTYYATAPGVYNMTQTNLNGCTDSASAGITVMVNPLPSVTYVEVQTSACVSWPSFALTAGSPNGGTYSGTGVSGTMFDPAVSGAGTFDVIYSYTDANGCTSSDTSTITVGLCTGLDELSKNGFAVFPNPSHGQFTISTISTAQSVVITDVLGQELVRIAPDSNEVKIDLDNQKSGVYLVRIVAGQQAFSTRFIISR